MRPIVIHSVSYNGYKVPFPLYEHEHHSPELLREVHTYGNNVSPGRSSSGLVFGLPFLKNAAISAASFDVSSPPSPELMAANLNRS